jgi:hypothetical protein
VFGQNKLHCLRSVPFLPHLPWSQAREPGQGPSVVGRWLRRHWLTWIFEIYIYIYIYIMKFELNEGVVVIALNILFVKVSN